MFAVLCCRIPVLGQIDFNLFPQNLTKNNVHCVGDGNWAACVERDKNEIFYGFGRSTWLYVGRILGRLKNRLCIFSILLSVTNKGLFPPLW